MGPINTKGMQMGVMKIEIEEGKAPGLTANDLATGEVAIIVSVPSNWGPCGRIVVRGRREAVFPGVGWAGELCLEKIIVRRLLPGERIVISSEGD